MENKEKRISIDASLIYMAPKVTFEMIRNLCESSLLCSGFEVGKMNLQWLMFSMNFPFAEDYKEVNTENGFPFFTFDCVKEGKSYLAIYYLDFPFCHVLEKGEYTVVSPIIREKVQFHRGFREGGKASQISRYIYRVLTVYSVSKPWYSKYPVLTGVCDRIVRRETFFKYENKQEAFNKGFLFSDQITDYSLFSGSDNSLLY